MTHSTPEPADSIGRTVFDGGGAVLGRLTALYLDADTRRISFAALTMTHWGRRRTVFVPLEAAALDSESIVLRCGGRLVRESPGVHLGRGLPAENEADLFAHYDMAYTTPASSTRRLLRA